MQHRYIALAAVTLLAACTPDKGERFSVSGTIDSVSVDTTLLFEAVTLQGAVAIDSVRLTAAMHDFVFEAPRPANPEFYRLRIGNELINLCIDSTEDVTVTAALGHMTTRYNVQGSEKCEQMRQMAVLQQQLLRDLNSAYTRNGMSPSQRDDATAALVQQYKQTLVRDYIAPDPASAVAYSALFQTIGGRMVFDPVGNRTDVKWITALATAWDALYPGTERTLNLHNVALQGMANTGSMANRGIQIDMSKVKETGIIDITLPDAQGNLCRVSDHSGKVVLLDFTAYSLPDNSERTLLLRDLYTHYHDRGLEIYQISFDPDRHFWATRTDRLPWTCVYCDEGPQADIVRLYNVQVLPTMFLIDRTCTLHARADMVDDLEAEIKSLL